MWVYSVCVYMYMHASMRVQQVDYTCMYAANLYGGANGYVMCLCLCVCVCVWECSVCVYMHASSNKYIIHCTCM